MARQHTTVGNRCPPSPSLRCLQVCKKEPPRLSETLSTEGKLISLQRFTLQINPTKLLPCCSNQILSSSSVVSNLSEVNPVEVHPTPRRADYLSNWKFRKEKKKLSPQENELMICYTKRCPRRREGIAQYTKKIVIAYRVAE